MTKYKLERIAPLSALIWVLAAPPALGADNDLSFDLEASAGFEYDDNITVTELDVSTSEDDIKAVFDASVGVENDFGQGTELDLSYNFSQSLHQDFTQFDLQTHRGSAGIEHDFGSVTAGLTYNLSYARLGGDGFLTLNQVAPFLAGYLGRKLYLRGSYEYRDKDFSNRVSRDAEVHAFGLDAFYFLNGVRTILIAGYKFEDEDAVADRFDFDGHNVKLRLTQRFSLGERDARLRLGWRYETRDYSSVTPSIGEIRDDDRHKLQAELEVPITDQLFILGEYEYSDFSSNLPSADYNENIIAIRLGFEL